MLHRFDHLCDLSQYARDRTRQSMRTLASLPLVDAATTRQLAKLLERRRKLTAQWHQTADELGLAVLDASEKGASRLDVARALGVGTSTVQGWVNRGRRLKSSGN